MVQSPTLVPATALVVPATALVVIVSALAASEVCNYYRRTWLRHADPSIKDRNDRDRVYATREVLPLPTEPPYTAHLGNLSFDATQAEIGDFFGDCEVTNVRIVEDKLDRKPKGFGYVEFASLDGLKKALDANGTQFQGRNIRVSVAEPRKFCHLG